MVNRDDKHVTRKRRPPAGERLRSEPLGASDSDESEPREHAGFRPVTQPGDGPAQSAPPPFFRIANGSGTRRGPSYPAWEKPPTPYDYPRLRSRERRKPLWVMWPPIFAAIGVALVLFAVVVFSAFSGHRGAAVASHSSSPGASHSVSPSGLPGVLPSGVNGGNNGTGPSPSGVNVSPAPQASYEQYKVLPGDTVVKIAKGKGLKSWELLQANPKLAPPYTLRIGSYLNIPLPGQLTPSPS
jgi:LysM repeat protein